MFRILRKTAWMALGAAVALLFDGPRGAERRSRIKSSLQELGAEPTPDPLLDTRGSIPPAAAR